jgi:hypothetical protein
MPAKKARKKSTVNWVDISLSKAESDKMKALYSDGEKLWGDLERTLDSGYKITLSADDYNDCLACYLVPKSEESVNFGAILTARGSDWIKALRGALYRHLVLFQGDKWTDHEKQVIDAD